jgi:hypothetical protein
MKYVSTNELNHFSFHDAQLVEIELNNGNMIWKFEEVNATVRNSQNKYDKDMCIEKGKIVFENIQIESIIFSGYKVYDSNNVLIKSVEAKKANPDEYNNILKNTCTDFCYIFSMEELPSKSKRYVVSFDINGGGNYEITLSFTKSIVKWNDFKGIAWYENEKWKKD